MPPEESSSDGPIYRHEQREPEGELARGDEALIQDVTAHVEAHVGPVDVVFHEIASTYVHVDVHHIAPTPERPWHVLVTSGMSARPMTTPPELPPDWRHAELLVSLPTEWKLSAEAFEDERNYWPVRALKQLARLPHEYGTWLGYGHTVPNGDPPEPYADNTKLSGMIVLPPLSLPESVHRLQRPSGDVVRFWSLVPLYAEEMDFKLKEGSDALLEKLDEAGVGDVVDPSRRNVVAKKLWPF